jgi:hypothetical protein
MGGWNEVTARALNPSSEGKSSVIRPWQPAFPQAMQRHGGQTRPAVPPVAKAGTSPQRQTDDDHTGPDVGKAPADATTETKK